MGEAFPLDALFAELLGRWQLERRSSDGSRFSGTADFTPLDDGGYLLREEGTLRLAGGEDLPARREWVWRLTADGEIDIAYPQAAGGGPYHRFRPSQRAGAWTGEAEHVCGRDIYQATYRLDDGELVIAHTVRGPAKDYRLHACYRRLDAAQAGPKHGEDG